MMSFWSLTNSVLMAQVGLLLAWFLPTASGEGDSCIPLPRDRKSALIKWVQKKNHLPEGSLLKISEISDVGRGCYKKLHFVATGKQSLDAVFYLTPDLKYLVPELIDFRID